ncbi:DUF2314 domain-containing protein [Xanthomonas populi]|uniref:DUF2314 domain-containing protein n=1 Tax=Xanthomonas populi TaxID=53414 RepID=A0A2S7EL57_9XANT|nr:DUF2314 domain-containing protein [Xanthomonas populi]PPU90951.1 hypothetical protein XpopCFBP1817_16155 [Xanthomonas populi]
MTDNRMYFANDEDAARQATYAAARDTFEFFWRELSWEYRRIVPGLEMAAVKLPFATDASAIDAPSHEHMWIFDVQFDGEQVSGSLLNDPEWFAGLTAGNAVSAPITDLEDWMYVVDGQVYGGLFGKLFGSKPAQVAATEQAPSEREHPMSENMGAKFDEGLRDQPDMVHFRDGAGWTPLQRDAAAGNDQPVSLLRKHGADASLRTPSGKTALDLARQMQWPRSVQLLEGDH